MRCNDVAGILAELMLGGPRQGVADRASWHEVEEHATHDLRCAIESLEEDPDLERGMGRRCDSCHGPSSTAFWMLSRHDLSACSVLLRRHKDALVGTGSRAPASKTAITQYGRGLRRATSRLKLKTWARRGAPWRIGNPSLPSWQGEGRRV